ncbi:Seryl-tRNA synthetase [invertebrate metagenome]|uniref:Serine--tRNA ligase n=1 Tax=invertebrate metagenome TaxID=1711999 RepID=A0A484H5U3_9ZZZZ
MFDIKWIRENPDAFDHGLARRGLAPMAEKVLALDKARRAAQTHIQFLRRQRNQLSKEIGIAHRNGQGQETTATLLARGAAGKDAQTEKTTTHCVGRLTDELEGPQGLLMSLPNLPAEDVPNGTDDCANVELRRVGLAQSLAFSPKGHDTIGIALGLMDFERASRLSGARFVILKGVLARLERALAAFMLDLHTTEFGYVEISPPALVHDKALRGTGQLPKFSADLFHTDDRLWLIPTAEVPLTNLVAGEILEESVLPLRYTAVTLCFRSEAGAAGKESRGMFRQHQFTKVELVSITHPEQSEVEHRRMTACAEEVLKRLGLPYRVVVLCTGDMGFCAYRTYDIEVWLPGQGRYREISSCSHCRDFQARRMNARFRPTGAKDTRFVHTLNGSGLAVGRTLVAVLENYQQEDGTVVVPEVLRPYMGGQEIIAPHV